MTITATIIKDSISPEQKRLTTIQARYPRVIHAEFMTHRQFSRNASSSRAIPVERLIQDVLDDPYIPIHWGKNQKGMQAHEETDEPVSIWQVDNDFRIRVQEFDTWRNNWEAADLRFNRAQRLSRVDPVSAWLAARDRAVEAARAFNEAGFHKQLTNRLLEPFAHINVVVTATEWSNFLALRDHPDAQPEIQELARAIKAAMAASTPTLLQFGEWHLPYVSDDDWRCFPQDLIDGGDGYSYDQAIEALLKVSAARCARVSYVTHEGRRSTVAEDLALYERLVGSDPKHASPTEHQARPDQLMNAGNRWTNPHEHGNLVGWRQFRKLISNECL